MSSFEKDCKGNAKSEYSKAFGGKLNLLERYKQIIGEKVCVFVCKSFAQDYLCT